MGSGRRIRGKREEWGRGNKRKGRGLGRGRIKWREGINGI